MAADARRRQHSAGRLPAAWWAFLCVLDDRVAEAFASDELAAMLEVGDQAAITNREQPAVTRR